MTSNISFDPRAAERRSREAWMEVPVSLVEKKPSRVWSWFCHGVVVVSVGYCAYTITPAHAAGALAQDVRIIHVSPSITVYGNDKAVANQRLESLKQDGRMELENQRSVNQRALAADKAYYEKLKDQRKRK